MPPEIIPPEGHCDAGALSQGALVADSFGLCRKYFLQSRYGAYYIRSLSLVLTGIEAAQHSTQCSGQYRREHDGGASDSEGEMTAGHIRRDMATHQSKHGRRVINPRENWRNDSKCGLMNHTVIKLVAASTNQTYTRI